MKIGEAGEAFFIFETAGDVPDDLITSPLVSATQSPILEAQEEDARPGSFGGKEDAVDDQTPSKQQSRPSQEPEFLDLDASFLQPATNEASGISLTKPEVDSPSEAMSPSSLLTLTVGFGFVVVDTLNN
jgi:phosphatidate phosphatase LPIN